MTACGCAAGPLLILLVGVPASGKSTWAYRNAPHAIVVSQDDLIDAITPSGFDYLASSIYAAAEESIARTALGLNRIVVVDRTNRTRALRQRWIAIAREQNCPVIAIVMSADVDTCRARNRSRVGPRQVCEERMERMIDVFEAPVAEEGFELILADTECLTITAVPKTRT